MLEQQKVGKARMIGYGVGIIAVIVVAAWKLIFR